MKVMLTSFGIEESVFGVPERFSSLVGLQRGRCLHDDALRYDQSLFHRMPPVALRAVRESFTPDYELLLLCDSVVMDGESFERLVGGSAHVFGAVAETFAELRKDGRVELVDYASILKSNSELLQTMLEHDMRVIDQWFVPLRESLGAWSRFVRSTRDLWVHERDAQRLHVDHGVHESQDARIAYADLHGLGALLHQKSTTSATAQFMVAEALESSRKRKCREYRDVLRGVLQGYLSYVNANIVLSKELGIGFHDWLDFIPFYTAKFLYVGETERVRMQQREQVQKLFSIAFPKLAILDTSSLLRAISDKRVENLRVLISEATAGKVEFDQEWANSILMDVFRAEKASARVRKILGYLTAPIGFLPWIGNVAQIAVQEAAGALWDRKLKQEHQWFYMLSDIADSRADESEA